MLKMICAISLAAWTNICFSQSKIEKIVEVGSSKRIELRFTWPDLITVKGWDKDEIKIVGNISINNGQNDDAFNLEINESSNSLRVSSFIKNHKQLPKKIMIRKNGESYFFNTDDRHSPEVQKFLNENGTAYEFMNLGVIKDIQLTIYVPSFMPLETYAEYGLIELQNINGELAASSKYGGVDIQVGQLSHQLKAGTRFGNKYSNLSSPLKSISYGDHPGEWDWISYGAVNNVMQEIQSEFGNIYIRK